MTLAVSSSPSARLAVQNTRAGVEVNLDARSGILHRNTHIRNDSLSVLSSSSAYQL